jgi:VWFA-related protein
MCSPEIGLLPRRGEMRKGAVCLALFFSCSMGFSQQSFIEQSLVINVEVPVRVFDGNIFVDTLGKDDFEVLEDGVRQKIEAVYLVKRAMIERREESKEYRPDTARRFYLFFELTEYVPKMAEAVEDFVQNVLAADDSLFVVTPLKTYQMKDQALALKSREAIAEELLNLVNKDCLTGNREFRSTVAELTNLAKEMSGAILADSRRHVSSDDPRAETKYLAEQLIYYSTLLDKLDTLRQINQTKFVDFAHFLKKQKGQKSVFLFYQREYIPQIDPKLITEYMSYYQDNVYVYQTLTDVSKFHDRQMPFDVENIKLLYSDASTAIHFLFLTTPRENVEGVYLEEWSGDVFDAFREMAEATGGFYDSSANPAPLFHNALQATENYYLLYYSPRKIEETERAFRKIEVRVKKGNYRILHRSGYYIN